MQNILNKQRSSRSYNDDTALTPKGVGGVYGTTWGAGMYGAFYSPSANRRTDSNRVSDARIQRALEQSNDFLGEIKDSIADTFKLISRNLLGINSKEDRHRGKGRLDIEDRKDILDEIRDSKAYKTRTNSITSSASNTLRGIGYRFTKRGMSDMVFGRPQDGSWRANGREYEDQLKQYTTDRMMLQGKTLKETYGGKEGAHDQIAKDFKEQQRLKRQIKQTDTEVTRRRNAGMTDADINSQDGGKLVDKLNGLLDKYASYDPTNTGRKLEAEVNPDFKPTGVRPSERFSANTTVHKNYRQATANGAVREEDQAEAARTEAKEEEEQVKQTALLTKIADSVSGKKPEEIPGESKSDKGILGTIFDSLRGLSSIWTAITAGFSTLMSALSVVSVALIPLTAALALLGLGKMQKDKIEADPTAPEFKDNSYAMQLRGEVSSVTQGTKVNQQKALRQLQPGVAAEMIKSGPQDENGLIDGYTVDQLQDMAAGKKPATMPSVPLEAKGKADAARLKPLASNSGGRIEGASNAVSAAKRDLEGSPITVVAPTTVNQNQTAPASTGGAQGPVRNSESTLAKYVAGRYQTS